MDFSPLTEAEATCLEYSDRSNEPRYLNASYRQFGSSEPSTTVIQAFKGANCLAFAKDGILYRIGARGPTICDERVEAIRQSN